MINKFKIKQISTNQYVLRRQVRHVKEYLDFNLNIIKVVNNMYKNVVFNSYSSALNSLQQYNNK